ncbi:hypothetical protein DRO97_11095 [Archaeoglobales archaeon]|nr:MAG: hypothetical protein DRO97_11095 [Archaeoglobales archaeon]
MSSNSKFSRKELDEVLSSMLNGFYQCFGNPVDCDAAIEGSRFCPLVESCIARFGELLEWERNGGGDG